MEPEARYTFVGTAVLMLLALLVAAVLWLRSAGDELADRQYKIYFVNQSLEGLEVRSDVRMRGIRIGFVTGFTFSSRRPGAVEVFIRVDSSAPVPREASQRPASANGAAKSSDVISGSGGRNPNRRSRTSRAPPR